jgi:hypothetical protein
MKKVICIAILSFYVTSCRDINPRVVPISLCNYTKTEKVQLTNLKLKVPNGMSTSYYNNSGVYPDRTFDNLNLALDSGDAPQAYKGSLTINLKSSAKTCKGDNSETIPGKNSRIQGKSINMLVPSSVAFEGQATIKIVGDDWKSKDGLRSAYVYWEGTGNDPQYNGINGNIIGALREYNPSSGKIVLQGKGSNSYYIKDGQKINFLKTTKIETIKMINTRIIHITIIALIFLVVGCNEDLESPIEDQQKLDEILDGQEAEYAQLENSYNVLDWSPTVYHDYFKNTESVFGVNSLKNPLQKSSIVQNSSLSEKASKGGLRVNEEIISSKDGTLKLKNSKGESYFGKEMVFSITSASGITFKDGTSAKEVSMYVPKELEITNPSVANEDEVVPYCLAADFVLEWNADFKNEEGLVVVAEYNGKTAIPAKAINMHITNTLNIEQDNGRIVLDNDIWKDMPDTAFVTLTILRGNVKIEEINEENYKFYALAQAVLPFVLIKDINTIEQ